VLSGTVTELAGRVLGGGHVIDVEARGAGLAERLAAIPGVVRVQPLNPTTDSERYRVDCQRDLRADIARRLAAEVELVGIHFAAPSLTEVYNRYFEEARNAAE
jgi:ABC-2 type transport system ATP-binding protein